LPPLRGNCKIFIFAEKKLAMKNYEIPCCEIIWLDMETSCVTGASAGGFPVDPRDPFSSSSGIMEEDDYE
jgi:hypothetical protein